MKVARPRPSSQLIQAVFGNINMDNGRMNRQGAPQFKEIVDEDVFEPVKRLVMEEKQMNQNQEETKKGMEKVASDEFLNLKENIAVAATEELF